MKILVVSDLHYSLKQFDWLVEHCGGHDLVVIAGDLMELGSYVDPDTQAAVLEQYFRKVCRSVPLVVCSGNHDLVEEADGGRSTEWLEDLAVPGLVVDRGCYENDEVRVLSFPWWDEESDRDRVEAWLADLHRGGGPDPRPELWVHHAPPRGTKTSWNGKRDLGDDSVARWIREYSPALVFTGHVHNAPYYDKGSWVDRIGGTVITNGGKQIGNVPATIVVELQDGLLTWSGMEGTREATFGGGGHR